MKLLAHSLDLALAPSGRAVVATTARAVWGSRVTSSFVQSMGQSRLGSRIGNRFGNTSGQVPGGGSA